MPIAVPGGKAHVAVRALGGQLPIDEAHSFDEVGPVEGIDVTEAGDDVADRHVGGRLAAMGFVDHVVGMDSVGCQPLQQPGQTGGGLRVVVAEPQEQLDRERLRKLRQIAVALESQSRLFWLARPDSEETIGDLVGLTTEPSAPHDGAGHSPQVLDEDQPKRGGEGPELPNGQWGDFLVGTDESAKCLRVEAAVEVRYVRPGDPVYPRVAGQVAVRDLGQFAVIGGWKVLPDFAELALNQVKVVNEPLGRRG